MSRLFILSSFLFCLPVVISQETDLNSRGLDPGVDYQKMYNDTVSMGIPWDDRNLNITVEDLAILQPGEYDDLAKMPVFYRIAFRKAHPDLRIKGKGQYPLSAPEVFELLYGGIMHKGVLERDNPISINDEVEITTGRKSAESAIAMSPVDSNLVISGVNGPAGQEMYYSQDSGLTWTRSMSNLGSSCCDPTVAWSPDGQTAYMAQLGGCFFACNIEFFISTDFGQTWGNKITVASGGTNDKEFLHVDLVPSSPYFGTIYIHYHSFNTIQFARSTDGGQSFNTPISFSGTQGIGGDITTDTQGKIYHVWQSMGTNSVRLNRSTDGGASFGPMSQVSSLNAEFNFFIPCFDTRGAPVIISIAADTEGSYKDRVYACWSDTNAPESGTPSQNHSKIVVASSSDGGDSWTLISPHSLDDILTVDRFNPWLEVDSDGNIHVVYYSTQNDPARLKPDLYHTISLNGGADWEVPVRVTAVSSNYISDSFQWGDYNGMSIVDGKVRPIWTDNRAEVRAFTADMSMDNPSDFDMQATNSGQIICRGSAIQPIALDFQAIFGFSDDVSLSFESLPIGFSGQFSPVTLTPPGQSQVTIQTDSNSLEGSHAVVVKATSGSIVHDVTLDIYVRTEEIPTVSAWWRTVNSYYDFNQNGLIDLMDLLLLSACYSE